MSIETYAATFSDSVLAAALVWLFSYAARIADGVRGIRSWGWSHLAYTLGAAVQTTALAWPEAAGHLGAMMAVCGLAGLATSMTLFVQQRQLTLTERRLLLVPVVIALLAIAVSMASGRTDLDNIIVACIEMYAILWFAWHLGYLREAPYSGPAALMRAGCVLLLLLYLADFASLLKNGSTQRYAAEALWVSADLSLWFLLNFSMVMLASFRALETMRHMAHIDPLTGALNRRGFDSALRRPLSDVGVAGGGVAPEAALAPGGVSMGVLVVDIDHFKQVNDRFGHEAGDRVLRTVATALLHNIRPSDLLARFGGEEFVIVLFDCDGSTALLRAECMRASAKALRFEWLGDDFTITISVGVAAGLARDIEDLRTHADVAMYEAKRSGRDRCVLHTAVAASSPSAQGAAG